jgi:hypothetical protein
MRGEVFGMIFYGAATQALYTPVGLKLRIIRQRMEATRAIHHLLTSQRGSAAGRDVVRSTPSMFRIAIEASLIM